MRSSIKDITGICVCSNTKSLIKGAYESVRKFHPNLKIIIIDGSDPSNICRTYVKSLCSKITIVALCDVNIGHGRGMNLAIGMCKTKFALIFDSDIIMKKSPVKEMLKLMESDTFGVGWVTEIGFDGYDYGTFPGQYKYGPIKYLHPYFQLISAENYKKFHPYVHHGAPCYKTMIDIHTQGFSEKILKSFLTGHTSGRGANWIGQPSEYIQHDFGGTRKFNKLNGQKEINEKWE